MPEEIKLDFKLLEEKWLQDVAKIKPKKEEKKMNFKDFLLQEAQNEKEDQEDVR